MKPVRSLLYVPANKVEWIESAPSKHNADAIIYDLEDAVPMGEKDKARKTLKSKLPVLKNEETLITVRVNAPTSSEFDKDMDAVCREGLDAVVVPKLQSTNNVARAEHVLTHLETLRNLNQSVKLFLLPETAKGFTNAEQLCSASKRVKALIGASSQGGDIERALGFQWTEAGDERQYFLSKLLMDGKAAGLSQLIAGPWLAVSDSDGLQTEATKLKQYGYTGFQVIHPSHIEQVNKIFTPSVEEAKSARNLLDAFENHPEEGVFRFDGEMVDEAHRKHAEHIVERAETFGVL